MKDKKNIKKVADDEDFSDNLIGALVGVQLADGSKHIGEFVRSNPDYIWIRKRGFKKPIDVPRIAIERVLVLLQGDKE